MQESYSNKLCLVTGGTGFIGGRLAERLFSRGARVRVLVRDLSKGSRVGRYPVEFVRGDAGSREDVLRAAEGCDHVFHCAFGNSGSLDDMRHVTVEGTRYVVEAALANDARLVNVSTISAYGPTAPGTMTEEHPARPDGDFYGETKLEAERIVIDAAKANGLKGAVLQPTVVYGPNGPAWTNRILNEVSTGRVILVDGGEGLCNAVYVDDVVQALELAGARDAAIGETFLVSGPAPVTWREFYGAYEDMLGISSHVEMSAAEARDYFQKRHGKERSILSEGFALVRETSELRRRLKATKEVKALLKATRAIVPAGTRRALRSKLSGRDFDERGAPVVPAEPEREIHALPPGAIDLCLSRTSVSVEKARRLLGYEPAFDFQTGMARVAQWARWAGLLDVAAETH